MTRRSEFVALVLEQMAGSGTPRARAMFGGHGIYDGDVMVAIVVADTLYLKTDADTRAEFEARGLRPFTYAARGRTIALTYYEAPPEVFEEPGAMRVWMQKALGAALRTAKARHAAAPKARRTAGTAQRAAQPARGAVPKAARKAPQKAPQKAAQKPMRKTARATAVRRKR